ncbi:hypothetical protein [Taibaiella koreensis]|uniref:hypothetical protein n=1 Tax=Taibaiella koreensis TaxID=1268548 RepID=UPI000E599256|nr:hypothetical protein [Taibaiella koreensis]
MKKYLFLFLLPLLLGACRKTLQCPAFDEAERSRWLSQATGSAIIFERETDHFLIRFSVADNSASSAYQEKPRNSGIGYYNKDCKANSSLSTTTGDASAGITAYTLSITSEFMEDKEQFRSLKYEIGDFNGGFDLLPALSMPVVEANAQRDRDSIVDNMVLGTKTYERVLIQTRSNADTAGKIIRKVYLAPGYGIVGFVSKGQRYIRQ